MYTINAYKCPICGMNSKEVVMREFIYAFKDKKIINPLTEDKCYNDGEVYTRLWCPECWYNFNGKWHGLDDPFWDGTDFAHPAWWRGHQQCFTVVGRMCLEWLDGKNLDGFMQEPFQSVREKIKKLLETTK